MTNEVYTKKVHSVFILDEKYKESIMSYIKYMILFIISSTATAQTFQGTLQVLIYDDFNKKQTKTEYQLKENDTTYLLDLPASIKKDKLMTGMELLVDGQETSTFAPAKNSASTPNRTIKVNFIAPSMAKAFAPQYIGFQNRKVLALLVNFNNLKATSTVSVDNVDNILYLSDRSALQNMLISSFGQLNLVRDTNNDGKADIGVVTLNYSINSCDPDRWARDALDVAKRQGMPLNLYQHFMFVIPKDVNCNWGGLGHLGCGTTCYTWVRAYEPNGIYSQIVYVHELGHNLGMSHSATDLNNDGVVDSEYGDAACFMGTGDFQYLKQANAPHRDQMRWFDMFSNRLKLVASDGQFTLSPLDAGVDRTTILGLKIPKSTTENYYVSYRNDVGVFGSGTPNFAGKISIHKTIAGDARSFLVKVIGPGETFTDAKNNISVTVEFTLKDYARVSVKK